MKVVIYARVSSDHQAEKELSIPAQLKTIHKFCQEKGWLVVGEYLEKGKSAKTDERPEFQKMIAMAKRPNRHFDAIVVHKFDRFSRKREDHIIYKALLQKHGVKVISATEQTDPETPHGMLLEGMLEVISEFYNVNLAAEVKKGMSQNAKQGYSNGGNAPYGYRTEHIALSANKTKTVWVLGPREEVDTIKWIFNQYAQEGLGYKAIATLLNQKGVPTLKGGKWSASTIRAIIFNESYIGRRVWNKQDYQTKGKKWKDRSEWIITENAHPSIITKELFDKCQELAKKRHNGGGQAHNPFQIKPHSPFWLRGIMYCDRCGSKMVGNSNSSRQKGGGQRYYTCGGYQRHGKEYCSYVGWRKERVEEIVSSKLRNALLRLSLEDNHLEEEIRRYHADQHKNVYLQISSLETEIGFLQKRIETMEQDILSGKGKPYYADMISEMKQELADKQNEYTALSGSVKSFTFPEQYIDSVKYDVQTLIALLDSEVSSPESIHQLVAKYVSRVFIQRETKVIHIIMQFKSGDAILYEKTVVAEYTS